MKGDWTEATKEHPCPVCKRDHFCLVGKIRVLCTRLESQKPNKAGYGWYHHRPDADMTVVYIPKPKPRRVPDAELHARWISVLQACKSAPTKIEELARQLGVASWTLNAIDVAWDGTQYLIPTKNAKGQTTGLDTRWRSGRKMVVTDSRRGLVYADNWLDYPGPVFIVEGPSDTFAALTLHLCVLGRPSNIGGLELLAKMLRKIGRSIIFVAERDRRDVDGHNSDCTCLRCHPGLGGPLHVAVKLKEMIRRTPLVRLLPDGAKDMRAYLNQSGIDVNDGGACIHLRTKLLREIGRKLKA